MQNNNTMKLLGFQELDKKYVLNSVNTDKENNITHVYISTKQQNTYCPKCGTVCNKKKDSKTRDLNHGFFNGSKCKVYITQIRYKCSNCGSFYEDISDLCQKYYRHTNVSVLNVIKSLSDVKMSVNHISKINNMDNRLINRLFDIRVHELGLNNIVSLPPNIGIDEFKGNMKVNINNKMTKIKYQIQITNLDTGKVIAVLPIKDAKSIQNFLAKINNKKDVKNVVIDMSMQFKRILKRAFKNAVISVDYFHVTKLVTKAVDDLRLDLWRKHTDENTSEAKDIRKYLKSLKNLLLTDYRACKNINYKEKIDNKLKEVFAHFPMLEKAYHKLQEFYDIKRGSNKDLKVESFKQWFNSIENMDIKQFKSIKKTMFHWYTYIKNYYITGLSNGKTEGNNNSIKVLKRVSYGFGNYVNAANRILVCC